MNSQHKTDHPTAKTGHRTSGAWSCTQPTLSTKRTDLTSSNDLFQDPGPPTSKTRWVCPHCGGVGGCEWCNYSSRMTNEQVAEYRLLARQWLEKNTIGHPNFEPALSADERNAMLSESFKKKWGAAKEQR